MKSSGESLRSKGLRRSIGGAPLSNSSRPAGLMSMSVQRPVTHPVIKSCEDGTLRIVIKSSTPSKGSTDCDGSGTVAQNFRPKITAEF